MPLSPQGPLPGAANPDSSDGPDYTPVLRSLMEHRHISSYRALAARAGVSLGTLRRLRRGPISQLQLGSLLALSRTLGLSLETLVARFSPPAPLLPSDPGEGAGAGATPGAVLHQEYQRLEQQLRQQRVALGEQLQRQALGILEPWMLQWPTAVRAAQTKPELPATRLLPLVRPVEELLETWGVQAIAAVGAQVDYDPQIHELMGGSAQPGQRVQVRYVGYRYGEQLLYRARVSPVQA